MKLIAHISLSLILIALLGRTSIVLGAEIEGIHFRDSYETEGIRLKIQGTGLLRYFGFIKAYVGALYLEEGSFVEDVLSDTPKRLEVEYFHAWMDVDFTQDWQKKRHGWRP